MPALWKCTKHNKSANGGDKNDTLDGILSNAYRRKPGYTEEITGPLTICTERALHATHKPENHQGESLWLVAMHPPFQTDGDKIGSLKRTFIRKLY